MKIKLSKAQWEMVGTKAGWMKKESQVTPFDDPSENNQNLKINIEETLSNAIYALREVDNKMREGYSAYKAFEKEVVKNPDDDEMKRRDIKELLGRLALAYRAGSAVISPETLNSLEEIKRHIYDSGRKEYIPYGY